MHTMESANLRDATIGELVDRVFSEVLSEEALKETRDEMLRVVDKENPKIYVVFAFFAGPPNEFRCAHKGHGLTHIGPSKVVGKLYAGGSRKYYVLPEIYRGTRVTDRVHTIIEDMCVASADEN